MNRSILMLLALALGGTAHARDNQPAPALGEADRPTLVSIIVDTWSTHVEADQLDRWLEHIGERADEVPLPWLESAAAALDLRSVDLALEGLAPLDSPAPAAFGSAGGNLVFTPLTPCRLLDTRVGSPRGGVIAANTQRTFHGFGVNFQTAQGGANGDCGLPASLRPEALAITLVSVNPAGDGYLTAYPLGFPLPAAASLNYTSGMVNSTGLILPINSLTSVLEFSIYSFQEVHVVADVTGYFARPEAAPLDCYTELGPSVSIPAFSITGVSSPQCPLTHAAQFGNCFASASGLALMTVELNSPDRRSRCTYENNAPTGSTARAGVRCCRVPGR